VHFLPDVFCWGYLITVSAYILSPRTSWKCSTPPDDALTNIQLLSSSFHSQLLYDALLSPLSVEEFGHSIYVNYDDIPLNESYADNLCDWPGITCDSNRLITEISLGSQKIEGLFTRILFRFN
jgi:hypothetical protein